MYSIETNTMYYCFIVAGGFTIGSSLMVVMELQGKPEVSNNEGYLRLLWIFLYLSIVNQFGSAVNGIYFYFLK